MRSPVLLVIVLTAAATAAADGPSVQEFVARHWRAPLPSQGPAPSRFSPVEASLAPEACGSCHPTQLADWRTSLHARTMGPGVGGQLVEMLEREPDDALGCYTCHAPLAEQRPRLGAERGHAKNPAYDAGLAAHGLVCAACHVRGHERFGPPRRDGSLQSAAPRETLPHNGATRTPAFLAAEFCRGCHQFEPGGLALNGKLLENTYEEWKASRFAREGVQCQDCHMPDRRHLWRGIHDPQMVRAGVTVTVESPRARADASNTVSATLRVRSTRVGHAFPTYVVPRVVLRGEQLDRAGGPIARSRRESVIGREVALDLSREVRDTRLTSGASAALAYRAPREPQARRLRLRVVVEPDAFYSRFFEALIAQGSGKGEPQLREALAAARRSPYTLFERTIALE
jgi:hypothetical protein